MGCECLGDAPVLGTVVDGDGIPLVGATVRSCSDVDDGMDCTETETDEDGAFELAVPYRRVPEDDRCLLHTVSVEAEGCEPIDDFVVTDDGEELEIVLACDFE